MTTFNVGDRVVFRGTNKDHHESFGIIIDVDVPVVFDHLKRVHHRVQWDADSSIGQVLMKYTGMTMMKMPEGDITLYEQGYTQSQIGDKDDDI